MIFSSGGFSEPARMLNSMMNPLSILLWEVEELEHCIKNNKMCEGLVAKYRGAVETGLPDFNVTEEI